MDPNALLAAAGKLMKLPLRLDPKTHRCVLVDRSTKQEIFIEFPASNRMSYIYAPLMDVPSDAATQGDFLQSVLQLNLFGLETNGFVVSIEPKQKRFMLHHSFPMELLTESLLVNLLKNFIGSVRQICAKIEDRMSINRKRVAVANTHYSLGENAKPKQTMRVIRI
jgi:hypothetical protein